MDLHSYKYIKTQVFTNSDIEKIKQYTNNLSKIILYVKHRAKKFIKCKFPVKFLR